MIDKVSLVSRYKKTRTMQLNVNYFQKISPRGQGFVGTNSGKIHLEYAPNCMVVTTRKHAAVMESQTSGNVFIKSKQLPPFDFARHSTTLA